MKNYLIQKMLVLILAFLSTQISNGQFVNGNFETTTSGGCNYNLINDAFSNSMSGCFGQSVGFPGEIDIQTQGCYVDPQSGSWCVGLACHQNSTEHDAIAIQLSNPLVPGQSYTINFYAYRNLYTAGDAPINIGVSNSSSAFGTNIYSSSNPTFSIWVLHSVTFTAASASTFVTVSVDGGTYSAATWYQFDNFSISSNSTIAGCTNPSACNYNAAATTDNGSCTFASNFYADNDGDGFGISTPTPLCAAQSGYVTNNTDCDDSNNAVNPNATEVCNSIDDNCNGSINENLIPGDPNVYPQGSWNLYAYNGSDFNTYNGFAGVGSGLSVNTEMYFAEGGTPSDIFGYNGCPVTFDDHSYVIKRQGFTPGVYNFNLYMWDDNVSVWVDGNQIMYYSCCGFWAGTQYYFNLNLNANSTVEVRLQEYSGGSRVNFELISLIPGCMNSTACNYNPAATTNDGSCTFASLYYPDADADGYGDSQAGISGNYTMQSVPFTTESPANVNQGPICDDCTQFIPIGFDFSFYGITYSNLTISSNGYVTFDNTTINGCCQGLAIPTNDYVNNAIYLGWSDWLPNQPGQITYYNLSSPNRLVINYSGAPEYGGDPGSITGQIVIFENGQIQLNSSSISTVNTYHHVTQGVENATGTLSAGIGQVLAPAGISNTSYIFTYSTGNGPEAVYACTQPAGYVSNNIDCDDAVNTTNPGASEICINGVDDNCSGVADENCPILGCTDATACNFNASANTDDGSCDYGSDYYADLDGDGYGAGSSTNACTQPAGYVTNNTDCDDSNPAVNPGANELCNGNDDDCDTQIDNGLGAPATDLTTDLWIMSFDWYCSGTPSTTNINFDSNGNWNQTTSSVSEGLWNLCGNNFSLNFFNYQTVYTGTFSNGTFSGTMDDMNGGTGCFTMYPANAGCTDPGAINYDPSANINDGSCVYQILGCIDATACNFNASANTDDGSCIYPSTYYVDADGDGYGSNPGLTTQGTSSIVFTADGLVINGSNVANPDGSMNVQGAASFTVPADGVYTFDWSYVTTDVDGPGYDPAYYINGVPVQLTNDQGADNQNGSVSVAVTAGSTFGFSVVAEDNILGQATLTITNFNGIANFVGLQACTQPVGYVTNNDDCNDSNSAVNPGVAEICNSIDDDCDGVVDDGVSLITYYQDLDGDGFGGSNTTVACFPPNPSYIAQGGDCEDFNPSVNPGVTEVCNSTDDNCNSQIDEGLTFVDYYADADGDGYGAGTAVSSCSQPAGMITDNTDCDDSNNLINPSASEVCFNSIDDNCNTQVDENCQVFGCIDATACNFNASANTDDGSCVYGTTYYLDADGDGYGLSTVTTSQGNSVVVLTSDGIVVTGSNSGSFSTLQGGASFIVPSNDTYTFNWSYVTNDVDGPSFDPAYYINGVFVQLTNNGGANSQSGSVSVSVVAGSTFGFAVLATDDQLGNATLTITNFSAISNFNGVVACTQPAGYVANNTDCNDSNSGINPGASEICNSSDDNCNSQIDEGLTFVDYYADADGDSYGAGTAVSACSQPAGYVTNNTDCNDSNNAIYPGATEVCNSTDDNCDSQIDEGLTFTNYYVDTDGDGYGAGTAVSACSQPAGYVTSNTDCNNAVASVNPGASEVCGNNYDDNCNGTVNEGCATNLPGENPSNAISMATSTWPNCFSNVNSTLAGMAASSASQTTCLTGEDKWYQFVATTEGVSILVNSTQNDILIELQTAAGTLVAQENAVAGLGNEILNYYGLTAGQVYKVGIRNYDSSLGIGTFSACVRMLKRGGCDYGPGPYSLCQYFKATWAGASGTSYRFTFTGTSGAANGNVYTRTQSTDICVLSNVTPTMPYGSSYNVLITNIYTLQDGAGNNEVLEVPALAPCTLNTIAEPVSQLRASDNCSAGPRFRSAVVASLPWSCGAINWRWEFVEVDGSNNPVGLPIYHLRNAASNYLNLGTVAALQYGKTYRVRTCPIFTYTGTNYNWGPVQYMCIIGQSGMIAEGANAQAGDDVKVSQDLSQNLNVYPNPTNGSDINIQLSNITSENVQVRVLDAMGRVVFANRYAVDGMFTTNMTFDRPLANGLYMIEASFNGEVLTQRMMVQK